MKKTLWFVFVVLTVYIAQVHAQKPDVYPGAVPAKPESVTEFLVTDSYADVKNYYLQKEGKPLQEKVTEEAGQISVFIVFIDRMPDPAGVIVEKMHGNSRWVNRIFSELEKCLEKGFLSKDDFEEIEKKYRYLQDCYYLTTEDGRVDEVIYKKYNSMIYHGGDAQALAAKAQELMMSGKLEEARELLKNAKSSAAATFGLADRPAVVDEWIKCLEEIADAEEYAFPVRIFYSGF